MKSQGDSYRDIFFYWAPELISQMILLTLPLLLDSYFVSQLNSTSTYAALGVANNFLHVLIKLAESLSVAAVAVVGSYNGAKQFHKVGESLGNVFWTTIVAGSIPAILIYLFSTEIYTWLNVPSHMAAIGAPFLKLRAIGVLFAFIYLAFIGFMKGVKNTRVPMMIFVCGQVFFLFFDYVLILGKWGFPAMRLTGSAIATLIQYAIMITLSIIYILNNPEYKKYFTKAFFYLFDKAGAMQILNMSWQIAIDKTALGFAYIQLSKMIAPMGKYALASFSVIKDLERLAFLPAIAFASVLTFLVSNRLGGGDAMGARMNVKKVLGLTCISVITILALMCIDPGIFVRVFDHRNKFSDLASRMFPIISVLVVFDFIQLILAAALRGSGDVRAVMVIRALCCYGIFWPIGTWLANLDFQSIPWIAQNIGDVLMLKFILIYGFFYLSNGIMGLLFLIRIKTKRWETSALTHKA